MAENEKQEIKEASNGSSDPKETTRSLIAQVYVWAFFGVIVVVFIVGGCNTFSVDEYKDMLVTVSVFIRTTWFIVGYYFKASKE